MKYFKKLVGERVYLSPMNVEDAEIYAKWMNDLTITNNLGSSARVYGIAEEKEWISNNSNGYQFAIVRSEDDALLGNCGFHNMNQVQQNTEVGIFIGEEDNHNKGYGVEVLKLLLEYGFDYLNLNNIMLRVFSFNERAIQCYKKTGFQEIGRRRKAYYLKGAYHDEVFMDIIRDEWKRRV